MNETPSHLTIHFLLATKMFVSSSKNKQTFSNKSEILQLAEDDLEVCAWWSAGGHLAVCRLLA
jgi:hypothetical protein